LLVVTIGARRNGDAQRANAQRLRRSQRGSHGEDLLLLVPDGAVLPIQ
jgi:hypothetical protein